MGTCDCGCPSEDCADALDKARAEGYKEGRDFEHEHTDPRILDSVHAEGFAAGIEKAAKLMEKCEQISDLFKYCAADIRSLKPGEK